MKGDNQAKIFYPQNLHTHTTLVLYKMLNKKKTVSLTNI